MKRAILVLLSILLGMFVGWYFGYTRPVAKQYRYIRDHFGMTDHQMAEAGTEIKANLPQYIESMKRTDDIAAALALGTLKFVNQGNVDRAKGLLVAQVASYYRRYHGKGGDSDILRKIEEAAQGDPIIAAEISKK